jgi:hypothetical protein
MCSPLTLLAELALRALIALSVARPAHRSVAHPQPPDEGLCEGVLLWLARSVVADAHRKDRVIAVRQLAFEQDLLKIT